MPVRLPHELRDLYGDVEDSEAVVSSIAGGS